MGPTGHHEKGASGAYRWLICTDSINAQRGIPDKTSPYAAEGDCAHGLGESKLNFWKGVTGSSRALQDWNKDATAKGYDVSEMVREVEKYEEYVKDVAGGDPERVLVEARVPFGSLIPGGFGTADAIVITRRNGVLVRVDVIDLKYGKGKLVEAKGNPQLRLYAYGAIELLKERGLFDPDLDDPDLIDVVTHIVQPRLDHFDKEALFLSELFDWAGWEVRPVVERIDAGDTERVAGEHCDFCRAQATCEARAKQIAADLDTDFDDFIEDGPVLPKPGDISGEQIAKLLQHKSDVEKYFNALKEHAYETIESGGEIPGMKLIAGRRMRKWSDEAKVLELFKNQRGLKQDEYAPRKLISPAQADKALPKNSKIRDEIVTTNAKPTLVDAGHKSPALEFNNVDDDFD